jgi:uncharacterized BrkB/YihY/UPF0761 family membrane protein
MFGVLHLLVDKQGDYMKSKAIRIVVDIVVSFVFFIFAAIVVNLISSAILGTTKNSDGDTTNNINGGLFLAITVVITLVFAVWFYKFLANHKISKVKEQ